MKLPFSVTVPGHDGQAPPWVHSRTFTSADPVDDAIGANPRLADMYEEAYMPDVNGTLVQALSTTPNTRMALLDTAPAMLWNLDSTFGATDDTGNGRSANTLVGGITVGGFADSPVSTATTCTSFDGLDDGLAVTTYNPFTGAMAVMGWTKKTNSTQEVIFYDNTFEVAFQITPAINKVVLYTDVSLGAATVWTYPWPIGQWVHWAVSVTDATNSSSFYANNQLVGTNSTAFAFDPGATYFRMGNYPGQNLNAKTAYLATWGREITPAEVSTIYSARV
jgi:hypothetical protein